jgi:hypothetical protein
MKAYLVLIFAILFILAQNQTQNIQDARPVVNNCRWNTLSKLCEDSTGKCTGKFCCKPTGKILNDGVTPGCACNSESC